MDIKQILKKYYDYKLDVFIDKILILSYFFKNFSNIRRKKSLKFFAEGRRTGTYN